MHFHGLKRILQEAQQKEIKFEEDDPDALRAVIRKIYGWPIEHWMDYPWTYWLNLARTADKYLEPELKLYAAGNLKECGLERMRSGPKCDLEAGCQILESFRDIDSDPDILEHERCLARFLQPYFHGCERFRAYLLSNPSLMLKIIANETAHQQRALPVTPRTTASQSRR